MRASDGQAGPATTAAMERLMREIGRAHQRLASGAHRPKGGTKCEERDALRADLAAIVSAYVALHNAADAEGVI